MFAVKGASDEWLLLMSVAVTDSLSLSSGLIDWEGDRVVVERGAAMLDGVAERLRREFLEYVWVRVASELSEVRRILTALGAERDPPVQ
ncbi:hypothetical protein [Streptomyces sp. NPDC048340]|uniref:hypothetical protein n=1 Tax=Streptomyces sp. NPDC048340 TaxID=3365537 RepID=UPI003723C5B0